MAGKQPLLIPQPNQIWAYQPVQQIPQPQPTYPPMSFQIAQPSEAMYPPQITPTTVQENQQNRRFQITYAFWKVLTRYTGFAWILYSLVDLIMTDAENALEGWLLALGLNGILCYAAPLVQVIVPYIIANGFLAYASIAFLLGQPSYDWADEIPYIIISVAALISSLGLFFSYYGSSREQPRAPTPI